MSCIPSTLLNKGSLFPFSPITECTVFSTFENSTFSRWLVFFFCLCLSSVISNSSEPLKLFVDPDLWQINPVTLCSSLQLGVWRKDGPEGRREEVVATFPVHHPRQAHLPRTAAAQAHETRECEFYISPQQQKKQRNMIWPEWCAELDTVIV